MAKFELKFISDGDEDYQTEMVCYKNRRDEIYIRITDTTREDDFQFITLDKSTAIKFSKTLRTEINKIKEVQNG